MLNNPPSPPSNLELLRRNLRWTFLVPHGKSPYYDSEYINTFCIKSDSVAYVQHVRRLDGKTGVRFLKMKKKSKLKKKSKHNYPLWFDLFLLAVLFLRQFFHRNYIIKTIRLRLNDGLEIWDVPLYKIILSRELFIKPRAIWSPHNFITPFWQTSTNHYILELTLAWL